MSLVKKAPKPLEYTLYVKVKCPACDIKGKDVFITLPARGLPKEIRCCSCSTSINIKGLYEKGKETICRESSETITLSKKRT